VGGIAIKWKMSTCKKFEIFSKVVCATSAAEHDKFGRCARGGYQRERERERYENEAKKTSFCDVQAKKSVGTCSCQDVIGLNLQ
jgi:hypothetical protein